MRFLFNYITRLLLIVLMVAPTLITAQKLIYKDASLPIEDRVNDLLNRMTVEEKVGQMLMFGAQRVARKGKDGSLVITDWGKPYFTNGLGGLKFPFQKETPEESARLNNELQKKIIASNRFGIPALFVGEAYNGVDAKGCTSFGRPLNLAASWNVNLTHDVWSAIGRESRLRGWHMVHSPVGDIARDPRFGRMSEGYGEDTFLTTEMLVAAVTGVQGDYNGTGFNTSHIGAVVKHFAGYSQVVGGRNFAAVEVSPRVLLDELLPPFKTAVQRGHALAIMPSHGDINGVASHGNPWLLTDLLRKQWGFNGYVVSDAYDVGRLNFLMKVAENIEEAVKLGLKAGVDLDLYSEDVYELLPEMVKKDPSLLPYIDRAAGDMLRTKFIMGLFDNPYIDVEETKKGVRSKENLSLAKEMDEESMILLKNENQILPLNKKESRKIALIGPLLGEDTKEAFESVAGDKVSFVAEKGYELTNRNSKHPELTPRNDAALDKMVELAKDADVSILFVGGDRFTAQEATFFKWVIGDRATIEPVGVQDELIQRVKALGKPVIVVLKHRRTLSFNVINDNADAVLDCWEMTEFGDELVAKVLFGEFSPSGKLPVTVPRTIGQIPYHYSMKEISFFKDYLFLESGPLYPFGYGLSYSKFSYSQPKLTSDILERDGTIQVTVDVMNTGKVTAKEVVQMYIKDMFGSVLRPDKELKGFEKIELKPGETKTVQFTITPDMLVFTGVEMKPIIEAGDYEVMLGTSSQEYQKTSFRLK
ncbi:glycoside hydrolase family 3 N-terminal domain-containing protein [Seonamhaeicola aphaedonensis]|uniref:beta-glucosidase n=1 Tax=Seonamhaeicola aphaedonensis TaxID=1461338 RepID=A0A3D9HEC5_9FLAO|nr:glycoside hydrolase family 3 N-terminal domain-containing protein [Seonamhaeicola aphaedonensis]RED47820.1 beta-glucosidase [Seonamhaeicola aphaedonensis]